MKNQRDTSLRIRMAGMAILALFIALAAAAYFSGEQVKRSSELITTDAVPGTIDAHDMRMAMARSIGYMMVAASAQTTQSRDASVKVALDADVAFTNAITQYETTIKINPAEDQSLLNEVTSRFAEFQRQRMAYEALILAGNRDGSAAFLESNLVPVYVSATQSAEELLKYNNSNSTTYAHYIRNSVHRLYLAMAVVMVLALVCAGVLFVNFAIRRREVKELRESEEKFAKAFQSSPSGITISELATGRIIEVNESYCRIQGYSSPKELIGLTSVEVGIFSSAEERQRVFQPLLDGDTLRDSEVQIRTRDGSRRTILFNAELIELGGKQCIVSLAQDVTERKRAEESLKLFRMLIDHAHDSIEVIDPKTGHFLDVNEKAGKLHGYTREEYLALTIPEIDPKFAAAGEKAWNAHLESLKKFSFLVFETEHQRKDGSRFPVEVNASYIRLERDYILAVVRDITERKKAEESLREKQAQLLFTLDIAKLAHWEYDVATRLFTTEEKNFQMMGTTSAQEGGLTMSPETYIRKFVHPSDVAMITNELALAIATTDPLFSRQYEQRIVRADGTERVLMTRYRVTMDAAGRVAKISGANQDITEQRTLENQFRQSQKMEAVGQLASGVAHDFNNILGIIQMQSDLLKTGGNLSPTQMGFASEIGEAAQRAAALTRQLLLFSRKEKIQMRELDLNQSVNDMTKMLRRTLGADIGLQFKFAMQPLFIQADAGMMDQVLMNLAVNARDAMPEGGRIVIETTAVEFDESIREQYTQASPGSFVCLSVSDTGSGIPPEILPKIFEPFFTTKDVGKGTGLGLATVFGIVQQHQGWINVYSEVGKGTTFRIYLPRLARISDQKFVALTTESMPGGKETILVVEDEPKLRASVRNILSHLGYNVIEASDGANALEVWKKHRNEVQFAQKVWKQHRDGIQLLLTDMVMPGGMTGKDLGEQLLKENPGLKVIYVSGYSAEVAAKDFPLQEGVNFLSKPYQAQKLAQTIRERLNANI